MAYIKLYTFEDQETDNLELITSEKIEIDNSSVPETAFSSDFYFSVEGRQMTVSFFGNDEIDNYLLNIRPRISLYRECMRIFAEVYTDDNIKLFSGIINSSYEYDDYDEVYSNVVIMDGLHCFINFHLPSFKITEWNDPYYVNLFSNDVDKDSYGEKVDIETLNLGSRTSIVPLQRYYFIYQNCFRYEKTANIESMLLAMNNELFHRYFPMQITNPSFEDIDISNASLVDNTFNFTTEGIDVSDVMSKFYSYSGESFTIKQDATNPDYALNYEPINNWDNSIEPYYLANGERNPKYFFMRVDCWFSINAYILPNGYTFIANGEPNNDTDYTISEKWVCYLNQEIVPYKHSMRNSREKAYLNQKLIIKKFRMVREDDGSIWYDDVYTYNNSFQDELSYYYINGTEMDDEDKEIISLRLIKGEDLGYSDSVISRQGTPSTPAWKNYFQNYLPVNFTLEDMLANYGSTPSGAFSLRPPMEYSGFSANNTIYTRLVGCEGNIDDNTYTAYGLNNLLSVRALSLNSVSSNADVIRVFLKLYNISLVSDINGNITITKKLRNELDENSTIFYLDDSQIRTMSTRDNIETITKDDFSYLFFNNAITGIMKSIYENIFNNFEKQKKFTILKDFLSSEPKINDIINYNSKQNWVNSIKLSDDYTTYTIKAYEVKNELQ